MTRVSKVKRLKPEERKYVEKLIRQDRLTLTEMIDDLKLAFPDADVSRSGIGRYKRQVEELASRQRGIDAAARVLVEEFGENVDDKGGQLLCQSITTLANHAALAAQDKDDVSIDDVRKLARAAKDTMAARTTSLKERQAVARIAREKAAEDVDAAGREAGLSEDTIQQIRDRVLQGGA